MRWIAWDKLLGICAFTFSGFLIPEPGSGFPRRFYGRAEDLRVQGTIAQPPDGWGCCLEVLWPGGVFRLICHRSGISLNLSIISSGNRLNGLSADNCEGKPKIGRI